MATEVLSTTRQAISVLGRDYFKPVLKPRGFRTAGVNFWRQEDGLFQSVAFQASMWGDRNAGRFTVNVGVTDPELYEQFTGRVPPKNSSLIRWPISRRVGHLMPEMTDLWWKVDEHADIVALGEEIAALLEARVAPFLDSLRSQEQMGAYLLKGHWLGLSDAQTVVTQALWLSKQGQRDKARKAMLDALKEHAGRPGEFMLRQSLKRLGSS